MNLYTLRYGSDEEVFEYQKFRETDSLWDINTKLLSKDYSPFDGRITPLGASDMDLLRGCGGTILYRESNTWIIHYLIDLDFKGKVDAVDDDWRSKIGSLILSIKRDMQLSNLVS